MPKIKKTCQTCGEEFEVWPSRKEREYCTLKCYYTRNQKLTCDDLRKNPEKLIELYQTEKSTIKIAKQLNCSDTAVNTVLRENNVKLYAPGHNRVRIRKENEEKYKDEIIDLYVNKELSIPKICDKLNIGFKMVQGLLKREGLSKNPGEYLKGEKNPRWNPPTTKNCLNPKCKKEFKAYQFEIERHKYCSKKCMQEHLKGKNSPAWKGGGSFGKYCPKFNNEFKERVT